MHDGLRVERAARVEAEAVSEQLRQEVQRIQEQHVHALRVNREGADRLKEQTEKIREISRANSALTIMLSEIQPRLTVLEQDAFSCRLPSEAEGRWNTAGNTLSATLLRLYKGCIKAINAAEHSRQHTVCCTRIRRRRAGGRAAT
jgi:DNA repair exonuclease SbcCD ATPase subunit